VFGEEALSLNLTAGEPEGDIQTSFREIHSPSNLLSITSNSLNTPLVYVMNY
jgi:hypothetical protein